MSQAQQLEMLGMYRKNDLDTCREAAADALPHVRKNQMLALRLIATAPRTDYELEAATGIQQTSIGKRRGELYQAGLVAPQTIDGVKIRRPGPSGSMCTVWSITGTGVRFLENES